MVAAAYILLVLIPVLESAPHPPPAGRLHVHRPAVLAAAQRWWPPPRPSAGCWPICAAPTRCPSASATTRGTDPRMIMLLLVMLFVILGDFIDAIPAIIIFMPIINKLTQVGNINPVHMGVVIITTLVFGLITPPYGLSLADRVEIHRRAASTARWSGRFLSTSCSSFTIAIHRAVPRRGAVAAEAAPAAIGRLFPQP